MAVDDQQFCLRWNNFPNNFASQFDALRHDEAFVDVTLTCEGRRIEAHKLVLSACSPYFKQLFKGNPCKHPIMFLHNVEFRHLKALVEFMYIGEVNVNQTHLPAFLRTAESLQIRGLADNHAKFTDGRPLSSLNLNSSLKRRDDNLPHSNGGGNSSNHLNDSNNGGDESDDFSSSILSSKRLKHSRLSVDGIVGHNMQPKLDRRDFTSELLDSSTSMNPFIGLETTVEAVNTSGLTLQGALDAATAAVSSNSLSENSLHHSNSNSSESGHNGSEGDIVKPHSLDPRPCPECGRVYSNISNLRQHIRLIHYPECIACPLCFKPFKNKLYLKRHLISYHELLPPSYMEKRYTNYNNSQINNTPPVFTYKSQPPDGFLQRHNNNSNHHSNNNNNSNGNNSSNNENSNNHNSSHSITSHHHSHHISNHISSSNSNGSSNNNNNSSNNSNRDPIMNTINYHNHTSHIMPVQTVLSSPNQPSFYPHPSNDYTQIPHPPPPPPPQQQPPNQTNDPQQQNSNDHSQVHLTSDQTNKQNCYSPRPTSNGPIIDDSANNSSDHINVNNSAK